MDHTIDLIQKSHEGDEEARARLVEENAGLVWCIVKRFHNRGVETEDLFQIGNIGLIKAIDKFDLSYDVKFSTYAVPMISGEIKRFLRDDGMIKVSRSLKELAYKAYLLKEDLQNQVTFLRQFCNAKGMIVDQCIEEYGSGLNYNRKKWNQLLEEVMEQKIKTIVVTHQDRFIRFGYDWFERFCEKFHTMIVIINNEELSPQEELVQDMISILHVFSCRLYGLRKYKNQIKRDEEIVKELQDRNSSNPRAKT